MAMEEICLAERYLQRVGKQKKFIANYYKTTSHLYPLEVHSSKTDRQCICNRSDLTKKVGQEIESKKKRGSAFKKRKNVLRAKVQKGQAKKKKMNNPMKIKKEAREKRYQVAKEMRLKDIIQSMYRHFSKVVNNFFNFYSIIQEIYIKRAQQLFITLDNEYKYQWKKQKHIKSKAYKLFLGWPVPLYFSPWICCILFKLIILAIILLREWGQVILREGKILSYKWLIVAAAVGVFWPKKYVILLKNNYLLLYQTVDLRTSTQESSRSLLLLTSRIENKSIGGIKTRQLPALRKQGARSQKGTNKHDLTVNFNLSNSLIKTKLDGKNLNIVLRKISIS